MATAAPALSPVERVPRVDRSRPAAPASLLPQPGAIGSRSEKTDGSVSVSAGQRLPTDWVAKIGVDVGLAAPAKTPAPVVAFLNKHLNEVIHSEAFRQRMDALGMTVPDDNTPEKLAAFMRRETARQSELAKMSGHQPTAPQR